MATTRLMLRCPKTGKPFPTGIAIDPASYVVSQFENNSSRCPHCGDPHTWSKENVFFESESHN